MSLGKTNFKLPLKWGLKIFDLKPFLSDTLFEMVGQKKTILQFTGI